MENLITPWPRWTGATLFSVLLASSTIGCQPAKRDIPSAKVAGEVTLDGQPLAVGGITFVPTASGQGPTSWAEIKQGKYEAKAVPLGEVLVRIQATRATGRKVEMDGMTVDEQENVVDDKHRLGVPLTVDHDLDHQNYALDSRAANRKRG